MAKRKLDKNGNPSTLISLKEYFDEKIDDLEEKIELQFKLSKEAVDKAEVKNDIRLESMNEFRNALKDQAASFLTRTEYEMKHQLILQKLDTQQKFMYMALGMVALLVFAAKFI